MSCGSSSFPIATDAAAWKLHTGGQGRDGLPVIAESRDSSTILWSPILYSAGKSMRAGPTRREVAGDGPSLHRFASVEQGPERVTFAKDFSSEGRGAAHVLVFGFLAMLWAGLYSFGTRRNGTG